MLINWDYLYNITGTKEFIYFISSPTIQQTLFPVKLVFIFFTICFFVAVIYFYNVSSYLKYKFLQDTTEFVSNKNIGAAGSDKNWRKIKKRLTTGTEADLKLAVIEADDYLYDALQEAGFNGNTFEELMTNSGKKPLNNAAELLEAHKVRNSIVYEPSYKLSQEEAKNILSIYESTINNIAKG